MKLKKNAAVKVTAIALAAMFSTTSVTSLVYADEMDVVNEVAEVAEVAEATTVTEVAETAEAVETIETTAVVNTAEVVEVIETAEASCETLETITTGNTEAGFEAASNEDGGAIAQESVEVFVEAAENLNAAEAVSEAASDIETAEEELAAAEEADLTAEEKAEEMTGSVAEASEIAESAAETVEEAKAQANDLIDIITKADSSEDQINEALEKLDTLTEDTKEDLETKKEVLDAISDRFEKAKNELIAANKIYEETVKTLKSDDSSVAKAAEKLEEAKQNVEALSEAYDNAKADLEKEQALVEDINAKKAISDKNTDWKTQNALMKSIMVGYIIPNMIDKDATNITFSSETQRGFDRQNSSYCVVKYLDKDNNEVTRYFNIDRTDRQYKESDQWYKLGSSRDIVIYEKPEEDITSSLYQIEHYGKKNVTSEFKADVNAGVYDVYAFDYEDGSKEYKCIDEIQAAVNNGDITVEDGVYYMNGAAGRKIVQTTGINATGIRVSTKDDEGLKEYIENASELVEKYEKYGDSIAETQGKIDEAIDKVEALEGAIEGIEDNKLRVTKSAVEDLGNYLSEEDMERLMAAESDEAAIEILEGILAGAKEDFEKATAELDELVCKCDEVKKQLTQTETKSWIDYVPVIVIENKVEPEETKEEVEETVEEESEKTEETVEEKNEETEKAVEEKAEEETPAEKEETVKKDKKAAATYTTNNAEYTVSSGKAEYAAATYKMMNAVAADSVVEVEAVDEVVNTGAANKAIKAKAVNKVAHTGTGANGTQAGTDNADVIIADGAENTAMQLLSKNDSFGVKKNAAKAAADKELLAVSVEENNEEPVDSKTTDNGATEPWWVIVFFIAITKIIGRIKMYF